jgi:PAS domain S-box-containing protein
MPLRHYAQRREVSGRSKPGRRMMRVHRLRVGAAPPIGDEMSDAAVVLNDRLPRAASMPGHGGLDYRRVASLSAMLPFTLAAFGVAAWVSGDLVWASLRTQYIPMAPSTALAFLKVTAAIFGLAYGRGPAVREAIRGLALLVFVLALIKVIEFVLSTSILNLEARLVAAPGQFGGVSMGRMSPVTAVALAAVGLSLVCLTTLSTRARDIAGLLATGVALVGVVVVVGYVYGAPVLYGGTIIPVAITTGWALLGTGSALIALTGPTGFPLRPFVEESHRASVVEQLHQQLRDRSSYVLAAARAGVWEVDLPSRATRWSDVLSSMFGLPAEARETMLDDFHGRIHPEDRPQAEEALQRLIERDGHGDLEFRVRWPDGTVRWLSSKGRVVRDASGTPTGLMGISLDVTERKDLERRLEQSQKMEALGQLAGGVAHDFNNLLTAIRGNADFLLRDLPAEDQRRGDLEEIVRASDRAAGLTRQLLAFSRKQILEPRVLGVGDVVREIAPMLRRLVDESIDLATVTRDQRRVKADPTQLQQVLLNLVVNARDAVGARGQITIEVADVDLDDAYARSHATARPGRHVMLAVSDTGHGMDAATQARIFEPFFTTKGQGRGTGLGLATVYGIVKQSGGHIWVYSEPGRGTTFKVYFGATEEAAARESIKPVPMPAKAADATILLAEDEAGVRRLVSRVLGAAGYSVHPAATAADALAIADNAGLRIDLLLTDVVMPDQTGRDVANRITARHPRCRVLFMSGYTDDAIVRHGVLDPDVAFIQKPFTADALLRKISDVLTQPDGNS